MAQNVDTFEIRKAKVDHQISSKTLILLFGWYRASQRATDKYCELYHRYGFDVLFIESYLTHLAWPSNSVRLSSYLLSYLNKKCQHYDAFLVHAFSLGAWNFNVILDDLYSKPELYLPLQNKIKGVVYDSLTAGSLQHMSRGVAAGLSNNTIVRALIPMFMNAYFWATHSYTVQQFDKYIELFKRKPLEIPTLLYYCKNDPMTDYDVIHAMITDWRSRNSFPIVDKCWDKSGHSMHLLNHPDDYISIQQDFLKSIPELRSKVFKE